MDPVPAVKLRALARYGLAAKAPTLRDLAVDRQGATLLATVRHLETTSVDDTLDVLDLLFPGWGGPRRANRPGSRAGGPSPPREPR